MRSQKTSGTVQSSKRAILRTITLTSSAARKNFAAALRQAQSDVAVIEKRGQRVSGVRLGVSYRIEERPAALRALRTSHPEHHKPVQMRLLC